MINRIIYRTYEWATTNPPRNITDILTLEKGENGIMLSAFSDYNGNISEKVYSVSEEVFSRLATLFDEMNITEEIKRINAEMVGEQIPLDGGGRDEAFYAFENEDEYTCTDISPALSEFIRAFKELKNKCGKPISEKGEPPEDFGGIGAFVPALPVEPDETCGDDETREGEWRCNSCGYAHNTGSFCTECGTKKSDD